MVNDHISKIIEDISKEMNIPTYVIEGVIENCFSWLRESMNNLEYSDYYIKHFCKFTLNEGLINYKLGDNELIKEILIERDEKFRVKDKYIKTDYYSKLNKESRELVDFIISNYDCCIIKEMINEGLLVSKEKYNKIFYCPDYDKIEEGNLHGAIRWSQWNKQLLSKYLTKEEIKELNKKIEEYVKQKETE